MQSPSYRIIYRFNEYSVEEYLRSVELTNMLFRSVHAKSLRSDFEFPGSIAESHKRQDPDKYTNSLGLGEV